MKRLQKEKTSSKKQNDIALKPRSATHEYPSSLSSSSSSSSSAKPSSSSSSSSRRRRRPPPPPPPTGEVVFCAPQCGRETRSADRRAIESSSVVLQLHARERDALGTLRRRHRRRERRKGRVGDDGGRGYRRVWLFERGSDRENE